MKKRAIITSALPYANGEIHLGHVASTYLPADVTTRFLKQNGVEAYYVCASDDFGTPILIQSENQGKTPADYVAHWNKRDYDDFTAFGIDSDYFYRDEGDTEPTRLRSNSRLGSLTSPDPQMGVSRGQSLA